MSKLIDIDGAKVIWEHVKAADAEISASVTTETERAKTAEASNASNITAETARAQKAEGVNAEAISAEAERAKAAESTNATAISDEVTRAKAAENTNATAISDETERAKTAESKNASAISAETVRAKAAESANATAIKANTDALGGHTVKTDVPSDAKFTDTVTRVVTDYANVDETVALSKVAIGNYIHDILDGGDYAVAFFKMYVDLLATSAGISTPIDYSGLKSIASLGTNSDDNTNCFNVKSMSTFLEILCEQIDANTSNISGKADSATTLSGYGITDAYTKSETDTALASKSDTSHKHVIADIDGLQAELDSKAKAEATNADGSKASRVSPLSSKKILVIGDSISTDAYANYHKWVTDLIEDETLTSSNVTNNSYHATGFVRTYDENGKVVYDNFVNRLKAVADTSYDIVVTFGGINDYIGAIDFDTFKTAVDSYFSDLTTRFLDSRLVVLTPLRTYNTYKNTAGHYQTEYSDYIKQVARSYCLPVLDLTYESGFYPFVDTFKAKWTLVPSGYTSADGVHPNLEYGKKFLAPMIRGFLEGLYASDEIELTGYYTQAEVDELIASGGVKFHWDAGERTASTVVRGTGLSTSCYYTNFNANTGGTGYNSTTATVDETSVTVSNRTYYGGVMVPFEVEAGKTYKLTCDIPYGLLSWCGLESLATETSDTNETTHGLHATGAPTKLVNNWSDSGGTQSFEITPTTPYIYIAFGNSDKKPVTWSNIKFVKK